MPVLTCGPEKRYATALFELAEQDKKLSESADVVQKLSDVFVEIPELEGYLSSKVVTVSEKIAAMSEVAQKLESPELLLKFIRFVGQEGRLDLLPGILFHIINLADEKAGKVNGKVATAQPLTEAQRKDVMALVKKLVPEAKVVSVEEKVDPALMGGLRLQVGSQAWDNTLRARLDHLKTHLSD